MTNLPYLTRPQQVQIPSPHDDNEQKGKTIEREVRWQRASPPIPYPKGDGGLLAKVNALRELQSETQEELDALVPSVLMNGQVQVQT